MSRYHPLQSRVHTTKLNGIRWGVLYSIKLAEIMFSKSVSCDRRRFPFGIYYEVEHETAYIYAILDLRRDPLWIRKELKDRR